MSLRCHVVHTACRSWVVRAGGTRGGSPSVIGIFCTWWGVNFEYETSFTYLVSPSLCVKSLLFRIWPLVWLWTRSAHLLAYLGIQVRKRNVIFLFQRPERFLPTSNLSLLYFLYFCYIGDNLWRQGQTREKLHRQSTDDILTGGGYRGDISTWAYSAEGEGKEDLMKPNITQRRAHQTALVGPQRVAYPGEEGLVSSSCPKGGIWLHV